MVIDSEYGQLLMVGIAGPKLSKEEKSFLKEAQPAGVIYFRRNVESPAQLRRLSQSINKILKIPPLIAIDQEGGRVARLSKPFTEFPGNDFLGRYFLRTGKIDLVRKQARVMARELKSIGVNYNFTPVADIHTNPRNPIIGSRSFASSAQTVAKLVAETVKAYRKEKVVSCAKHFPGHGDTYSDSHKALPTVRTLRATLLRRELRPFVAAIRAGVPTIMTAHVVYIALDPSRPATLSHYILEKILRKKLGFKGVIVSDDLEMNAIAAHGAIDSAAVESINAGADLLLVCKSLEHSARVLDRIRLAVRTREIKPERIRQALGRIHRMKAKYLSRRIPHRGSFPAHGWPEHRKVAEKIRKY